MILVFYAVIVKMNFKMLKLHVYFKICLYFIFWIGVLSNVF